VKQSSISSPARGFLLVTFPTVSIVAISVLVVSIFFSPLLNAAAKQSRAVSIRPNSQVAAPGRRVHSPRTIWERMQDPRGWWQSRLAKVNSSSQSLRARPAVSGVQPLAGAAIANPIFSIPPTFSSGGKLAGLIEVGDVNGDGRPDIVILNDCVSDTDCTQSSIAVLLGNGDGTYQSAILTNTGAVSATLTVGDFNRDGKLDVAVSNQCPDPGCMTGSVSVLLGNGDGTLRPPVAYPTGGNAFSVESGDINGDGKPDLVVANTSNSAGVLLGNGDGTFKSVTTFTTSTSGNSGVFLGDFNGDSRPDLVAVTAICGSAGCDTLVTILLGNGDGTFQSPVGSKSFTGFSPQAIALGDVNGDGKLDAGVVENCVPIAAPCGNETVNVLLGNGDGTINAVKTSPLGSNNITSIGFAELSGDSKLDLVTVDETADSATVLLGAGDGTFQPLGGYDTEGSLPLFSVLADLNGDGKIDLAVSNGCADIQGQCVSGSMIALLGDGKGGFAGPASYPLGGLNAFPVSATADFNGDGKPDLAVAAICVGDDCNAGAVTVFLSDANGAFQQTATYSAGGFAPFSVVAKDLNGDGKTDLAVVDTCASLQDCSNGLIGVLLGNGDGTFQAPVSYPSGGAQPQSVAVGDFDGDGKLDLAVAQGSNSDASTGIVSILLGNGDGSFRPAAVSYSSGDLSAQAVAAGDFNGDGKLDLAVANGNCALFDETEVLCGTGSVGILLGNGDGTFQPVVRYSSVDDHAFSVVTDDFNGDGKLDLVVANANCTHTSFLFPCNDGSVAVFLGKGDGTFAPAVTYSRGGPWPVDAGNTRSNAVATADFNGDGHLDLALSNRDILLGNGDGTFQPAQSYNPGGIAGFSALATDFSGDGKPDLAVTGSSQVTILLNISSSGFQQTTSTTLSSSRNPANVHHHVTFTATVTSSSITPAVVKPAGVRSAGARSAEGTPNGAMPTGSVTFSDGSRALGTVSLVNGKAEFSTSSLEAGVHPITATYSGDESFNTSTSAELDQVIRARTSTKLTSSQNPSHHKHPVTFTASVSANSGEIPTGKVTFRDFHTVLATVELNGGQASFTTSSLHRGRHAIRADYGGSTIDHRSFDVLVQRVK
jgi:Bacterial Ig-like domain (group 3)/FG-GAP-like repeat